MRPDLFAATDQTMRGNGYTVIRQSPAEVYYQTPDGETVYYRAGKLESRQANAAKLAIVRNHLAQAYSRATVYATAQANGWTVRQTGANAYEVQR
jgi:hypothetical protein